MVIPFRNNVNNANLLAFTVSIILHHALFVIVILLTNIFIIITPAYLNVLLNIMLKEMSKKAILANLNVLLTNMLIIQTIYAFPASHLVLAAQDH